MKWPNSLTVVRHGESAYNILKAAKAEDPDYIEFREAYKKRKEDPETARRLAGALLENGKFVLGHGDNGTPLTQRGQDQAYLTGQKLKDRIPLPDVILVTPHIRGKDTLSFMAEGWSELAGVKTVEDERVREQEHGLALLYSDWRIFQLMHPEQEQLRKLDGPYWYRYPQGENVPDVRERQRSILGTMTRDYSEQNVLIVTHHLFILATRANLERLDADGFQELDKNNKPINCGVTVYRGQPDQGSDGRLVLDIYNEKLY